MKDRDEERNNYIVQGQQNTCIRPQFFKGWIVSSAGENFYPLDSAVGFPKGRYTRRVLLPEHAPGARSGSKAPSCVPTISWVYFILGSRISAKCSTIFNRLNTWERAPGANNAPSCVLTRAK